MARRSPFKHPGPGRPKLSPAAKRRAKKLRIVADQVRASGADANYCIVTASGSVWRLFLEFSGIRGAKASLDASDLSSGAAVVRVSDGVELAHRSGFAH